MTVVLTCVFILVVGFLALLIGAMWKEAQGLMERVERLERKGSE